MIICRCFSLFVSPGVEADTTELAEGQQRNVTALRTIALTNCTQDQQCDCAVTPHETEQPVPMFYVLGADPDKKGRQESKNTH